MSRRNLTALFGEEVDICALLRPTLKHIEIAAALAALEVAAKKFPVAAKSRVRAVQLQLIHDRSLHR